MEQAITESDASQRFSEVLREVRSGRTFVVTADGRPVAKVMPVEAEEVDLAKQAHGVQAFLAWAETQPRVTWNWRREDLYD